MTESSMSIPIYEGSMVSVRSATPNTAKFRPITGLVKR
ncbi:unnamed protein product, partial [Rotaria socialis]